MISDNRKKWLVWASLLVALLGICLSYPETVSARPLQDMIYKIEGQSKDRPAILPDSIPGGAKVIVPGWDPNKPVYMDARYSFVPIVSSRTEVIHSGSAHGWRNTQWSNPSQSAGGGGQSPTEPYYSFYGPGYPNNKGNAWIKYTHIGTVDNRPVDLQITVNDWSNYFNGDGVQNISFSRNNIAVSISGYSWVDMTWRFLDNATGRPVNVSGYFTFEDIDLNQGVEFSQATSNAIDAIVLDDAVLRGSPSKLQFYDNNGKIHIRDIVDDAERAAGRDFDVIDDSGDPRYRFSMLYSNQNNLRFRWTTDHGNRAYTYWHNRNINPYPGLSYAVGDYMFYALDKPLPTLPAKSQKTGSIDPVTGKGEYIISHSVPQEAASYAYSTYRLIDKVESGLRQPRISKITNQYGENVTSWFDLAHSSTQAVATARPATLRNARFYGNTYSMHVSVDIDYDHVNGLNGQTFSFENNSSVVTNNITVDSQIPPIPVPKERVRIRHINQDNGDVLSDETVFRMPGSTYSEKAQFNGSDYGTEGNLDLLRVDVNGSSRGRQTTVTGTVRKGGDEIVFYYRSPFNVSHTYVDDDNGDVIYVARNVDRKWKGESWQYHGNIPSPHNTFEQNGVKYPYYPIRTPLSGVIDFQGSNKDYRYNVEFRYKKPNIDAALDAVRIYTDHKDNGLPVEIDFDLVAIDEAHWGGQDRWLNSHVRIQILDHSNGGQVVVNTTRSAAQLRSETLKLTIPRTNLGTDQKRQYEVRIQTDDARTLYVRPGHTSIRTHAYTASEDVVTVDSDGTARNRTLDESWVAMTEKAVNDTDVTEYMEGLFTEVNPTDTMPTGYGHGAVNTIETWTELGVSHLPKVEGDVIADPELADGNYDVNDDGKHVVDVKEETAVIEDDVLRRATNFKFAQTYVTEGGTGDVIVANTKPSGAVDGGNRMYIPVWLEDLGSYSYTFESTEPIGRNHVTIEVEHIVDVESYMLAHSDSPSIDKDALLLQPIFDNWFSRLSNRDPFEVRREYMWQAEDFAYDGDTVVGFSPRGVEQYNLIPTGTARLEIPSTNPHTGEVIRKIKGTTATERGSFYNYVFVGEFVAPSIEYVGDYAFYNAEFSGQFSAPKLTEVGRYGFRNSAFTGTLNAPELTKVGNYGFYHSMFDGDIDVPHVGEDAFYHSEN